MRDGLQVVDLLIQMGVQASVLYRDARLVDEGLEQRVVLKVWLQGPFKDQRQRAEQARPSKDRQRHAALEPVLEKPLALLGLPSAALEIRHRARPAVHHRAA